MCALPWNGIFVNPDGQVKNCSISGTTIGNLNHDSLSSLVNNSVNQQIRTDMLGNIRHPRCNACYSVEDIANTEINHSNRTWYKKIAIKNTNMNVFDSAQNFELSVLDLRWRNTCNFACVYCGPDLSSNWAGLMQQDHWNIEQQHLESSKQYIFSKLATVKHVYLAGGEPLLMKDNLELLTRLWAVNPNAQIRINSNISNLNGPVFQELKKFHNVVWTLSVESMHECFEYMRWPGRWQDFVTNSVTIKNMANDQINFNMVWCILNADEIFDTVDFLIAQGFHENMFVIQCLGDPSPLSVLHLPSEHLLALKLKIQHRLQQANPEWWLYKSLDSMYNFLNTSAPRFKKNFQIEHGSDGIAGTIEFLKRVDQLRGTNSQHVFPDLYNIHDSI